jgi:hypothetical protein
LDLKPLVPLPAPEDLPPTLSLFLEPGPDDRAALDSAVVEAGLGSRLLWIGLHNVDTTALSVELLNEVQQTQRDPTLTPDQALSAFVLGYRSVLMAGGAPMGYPAENASHDPRVEITVVTDDGSVDPVAFFSALAGHMAPDQVALTQTLCDTVGQGWPVLESLGDALARLHPSAVLLTLDRALGDPDSFDQIRLAQKALYWPLLLAASGWAEGAAFQFLRDDFMNPFALEAAVEYFIAWPEPELSPTVPAMAPPDPERVNFHDGRPHLVLIEPFSHARLGSSVLPGPHYVCDPYGRLGTKCDTTSPDSLAADLFDGLLFLVYGARVLGWYRWASYTGKQWEDASHGDCSVSRSIAGNREYFFDGYVSGRDSINLTLRVAEDADAGDTLIDGARHYFRSSLATSTQTNVRLHNGWCNTDGNARDWSGSAGCLVSPSYYLMRNRLIEAYLDDHPMSAGLETVRVAMTQDASESLRADAAATAAWAGTIRGGLWLVHPDEPTQKN